MRKHLVATLSLFLLVACPAHAGTFSVNEQGQLSWKPSNCQLPQTPPSLLQADRESAASDMNQRAKEYNAYVPLAQAYMNCVSAEAEQDAAIAGGAVTTAGQGIIDSMQKDVEKMGASVKEQSE